LDKHIDSQPDWKSVRGFADDPTPPSPEELTKYFLSDGHLSGQNILNGFLTNCRFWDESGDYDGQAFKFQAIIGPNRCKITLLDDFYLETTDGSDTQKFWFYKDTWVDYKISKDHLTISSDLHMEVSAESGILEFNWQQQNYENTIYNAWIFAGISLIEPYPTESVDDISTTIPCVFIWTEFQDYGVGSDYTINV
jgi:hypothetical protein